LRLGRRGVISLPIRLAVVSLVIALSLPLVAGALEDGEASSAGAALRAEAGRISSAVERVHYAGEGAAETVSVRIPDGCELTVGGEGGAAYSMGMSFRGRDCGRIWMDMPAVRLESDGLVLGGGDHILMVESRCGGGGPYAEVTLV
jgi:hypothetical protein